MILITGLVVAAVGGFAGTGPLVDRVEPAGWRSPDGELPAQDDGHSGRVLLVGVEVDRHQARLVSYTVKDRSFAPARTEPSPRAYDSDGELQLEIALLGPAGRRYTRRFDAGPLCLDHEPEMEPHVEGDTIRPHRDAFLVELPEIAGFDRLAVAYHERHRGSVTRRELGADTLDRERFNAAAADVAYESLLNAVPGDPPPPARTRSTTLLWPEDFADPDLTAIYGNPAEGDRRLNIVIIPDGYTYAQKSLMEQHATDLVNYLRAETPIKEHDPLINYTLVYAYSLASGTDQCDCGIVVDTAFGTRFPDAGGSCGSSVNRCLSYGGGCDDYVSSHLLDAEMRAPYHDETILMVNTTRYGGCAGSRSTYSAGHSSGEDVGTHELGHSVAGLSDEYVSYTGCGSGSTVNTSTDPVNGSWPEWIADIGAPREGARYWSQCIYRPESTCKMRSLFQDLCAVCTQKWALTVFGASRVSPTAPIESVSSEPTQVVIDTQLGFDVTTRLAQGAGVTNSITWTVDGPGFPGPTVVATGVTNYDHTFDQLGDYSVTCEVVADTNFIKPEKYGANRDVALWNVEVVPTICEVGCADGLPQCDADNDGLGDICDPCPGEPLNSCFGPVSLDNTALVDLRIHTDSTSTDPCSGSKLDCRGQLWIADFGLPASATGYNQAGDPFTCDLAAGCPVDASSVFGCSDAPTEDLLRCEHRDPAAAPELLYTFDVPDGEYLVNLLFMNTDSSTTAPGDRSFSVAINGDVPVQLEDFDPVVAAGGSCDPLVASCAPVNRSTRVEVSGGAGLQIELLGGVGRPSIQGIEVLCSESTWYRDADLDGYGDPGVTALACYQPSGFVTDSTDCNDTCFACHPGAVEQCDGLDNDCDLATDEDEDLDGYGVCDDCLDTANWQWAVPGEVTGVEFLDQETFRWVEPVELGGTFAVYSFLRSDSPSDFSGAVCTGDLWFLTEYSTLETPVSGSVYHYLVRADSFCGPGTLGFASGGMERSGDTCSLGDGTGGSPRDGPP